MVRTPRSNNNQLSGMFFERLLDVVAAAIGPEFVDQFNTLKRQREQFLQDHWTAGESEDTEIVFREVDYEYLITSLRKYGAASDGELIDVQIQLAEICHQFGELQKAFDLLQKVRASLDDEPSDQQGRVYLRFGLVETHRNQWQSAQRWFQQALDVYTELEDAEGMAKAHMDLGILIAEQWDTATALSHFEKARELLQGDLEGQIGLKLQNNLVIMQAMRGETSEAIEQFAELLSHESASDPANRIYLMLNYGLSTKEKGDLAKAQEILTDAVKEATALPNTRLIGLNSLALSEVLIKQGDHSAGQEHLVKAFKIFSQLHDRASLADTYRVFGILHRETGYPELAAAKFDICLEINRESGNLLNLYEAYYEYSLLAKAEGDSALQKQHLEDSLFYAKSMGATPRIKKIKKEMETQV
ncbi:MAG TPA: tetratricopeptide repeat protein [bacterium]|nr:tetratricopeptide repeat protein [bacterium]